MTQYRENLRRVTDLLTHRREEAERIAAERALDRERKQQQKKLRK